MSKPPPLPSAVLARVLRISGIDAGVLIFLAGGFGLISAFAADWLGAVVGGCAAGAGIVEWQGRRRLRAGDITGIDWLVRSQCLLLSIVLAYVAYQYFHYNPRPELEKYKELLGTLEESLGLSHAEFVSLIQTSVRQAYIAVAVASVLFQGGLAFYYHKKTAIISLALRKS